MSSQAHRLLDGAAIEHAFIFPEDLPDPESTTVEQIADGALLPYLPAPGQRDPSDVTLCITSAGAPMVEHMASCLNLERAAADRHDIEWTIVPNGPYMDQGRNKTVFNALAYKNTEWVMTLDDDVAFRPADIYDLIDWAIEHRLHAVGGIYASPRDGQNFAVAYRHDLDSLGIDGKPDGYIDLTVDEIDAMDPDDPTTCQVAAVGTGFLLIHRSVLELMRFIYNPPQPWFAELTVPMPDPRDEMDANLGTHMGEDLTFCRRLWAIGVPVHVAPHIRLTHFKKVGITIPPHPSRVSSTA